MEEPVTRLVDGLIDRIAARGSADLIADLAAAVPVEVIGNLLAVPREERGPLATGRSPSWGRWSRC